MKNRKALVISIAVLIALLVIGSASAQVSIQSAKPVTTQGRIQQLRESANAFFQALNHAPHCITRSKVCTPEERRMLVSATKYFVRVLIALLAVLTIRRLMRKKEPTPQEPPIELEAATAAPVRKPSAAELFEEVRPPSASPSLAEQMELMSQWRLQQEGRSRSHSLP